MFPVKDKEGRSWGTVIDLDAKPEFTPEQVAKARVIVGSLSTAAFANLDEDRTVALAKAALLEGVL
jgi:hypothetical protein